MRKRKSEIPDELVQNQVEQIPIPAEDSPVVEEPSSSEIIFSKKRGPRLMNELYFPDENTKFWLLKDKQRSSIEPPLAVRVVQEGGAGFRLELYYKVSASPIGIERFDGIDLFIQDIANSTAGQMSGLRYGPMAGVGVVYGKLEKFEDIRLQKYVFVTSISTVRVGKNQREVYPWEAVPFNVKTLGALQT